MRIPQESNALQMVAERLADLLGHSMTAVTLHREVPAGNQQHGHRWRMDAVLTIGAHTFVVEWKGSGTPAPVRAAIDLLSIYCKQIDEPSIPLVAVPYMGKAGRQMCREADVAWVDLSGNGRIVVPGMHIHIEGMPDLFKQRGRPSSAFAPKSSRIARWLLMHPGEQITQSRIASETGMDQGFTSRILKRLQEDGLILRGDDRTIRVTDHDTLLDAWHEAYRFTQHEIIRGHIAARTGEELLASLAGKLVHEQVEHAATGLGAAWLLSPFASFRTVTFYLDERPRDSMMLQIGFREEPRGANTWLVVPRDEGVFQGVKVRDGVRCVHPVQVYIDLQEHPERSREAADELRKRLLRWGHDA